MYFRSQRSTTKKAKNAARGKLSIFREINNYLLQYVDFPKANLPVFEGYNINRELSLEDIENIAMQVREFWKLGIGPIDNLTAILQKNGIMISVMDLNNKKLMHSLCGTIQFHIFISVRISIVMPVCGLI